ncbi:uncharacterized protein Z520_11594 [Fonsecaea multimorphosa CBS 102226]|uniref:DUF6594 domain-containing protein n=1 Tax=Fonsecaea multimorphosa CBS 102226 TaxID=1442371 RepID=A0A0D2JHR1_9EURO|nr:uncharacterized protein Z520_11594 [Fonsecaea multimorphosa CBS 102226]KIX92742.1 hypothetical protein Z520_11594 [Fonsecaea multimorphosa CBS 102226]
MPANDLEKGDHTAGERSQGVTKWDLLRRLGIRYSSEQHQHDHKVLEEDETDVRALECAVKGWPRIATFVDSDPNFMIFRRFGFLRTRLLLWHQDVLREMESRLDYQDMQDAASPGTRRYLSNRDGDDMRTPAVRKVLFQELDTQLKAYVDDLLSRSAAMYQWQRPDEEDRASIANLIYNDGSLARRDRSWIRKIDDLIVLGGEQNSTWVHGLVSHLFTWTSRSLVRCLLRSKIQDRKLEGSAIHVQLYERKRFNRVVGFLYTIVIVALIMCPVLVLYRLRHLDGYAQNLLAFAFTIAFALLCSTATAAKQHEIFGVTAAYCAVLVVFTNQNTNGDTQAPTTIPQTSS